MKREEPTMSETIEPLIVVGVDGSNHSKEALRWAVAQAKAIGGRVHAVMSWEWNTNPFAVGTGTPDELVDAEETARRRLADTVASAVGTSAYPSSAGSNRARRPRCSWTPPRRRT